ncbi:MAG: type VII toxin-antitoxin system MntA family adenylyltransferase antitoxin [Clostridium sp.]|uniref:type VII toxin-antitoxin system MntA family adenylyltransferase antitoxin n=1 Tax=Clostridium sp. TaxID=1506 RepID=UPI003F2F3CC8
MFKDSHAVCLDNKDIIEKIKEYLFQKSEISMADIFGSFDTEDFNRNSDIDIAILTNKDFSYEDYLKMSLELEELIGIPVDLNDINKLPEYIQVQIVMENRQLFSKDDILEQKFLDKLNYWIKTEFPFWKKMMQ